MALAAKLRAALREKQAETWVLCLRVGHQRCLGPVSTPALTTRLQGTQADGRIVTLCDRLTGWTMYAVSASCTKKRALRLHPNKAVKHMSYAIVRPYLTAF